MAGPQGRGVRGHYCALSSGPLARRRAAQGRSRAVSGRSVARSMRVMSAQPAASRPLSQQTLQPISIQDVYKMAESTRMRKCEESRQLVLTRTQKLVRNDSGMSRPVSGLTPRAISAGVWREGHPTGPPVSRCRDWEAEEAETTHGRSENVRSPGEATPSQDAASRSRATSASHSHCALGGSDPRSRHNSRLGSALTLASSALGCEMDGVSPRPEDGEARRLSVSRQCCEVMGPGVCRDCQKLRARMKDRERMEADFPRLRISEKNVTTSAVVMRVLPEMSQAEIQDKITRGEIDRSGLHFPPHRLRRSDDSDDDDCDYEFKLKYNGIPGHRDDSNDDDDDDADSRKGQSKSAFSAQHGKGSKPRPDMGRSANSLIVLAKLKLRLAGEASTPFFFMNLKHMNSKIYQGRVERNVNGSTEEEEREGEPRRRRNRLLSVGDPPMSVKAFVSPRKVRPPEEPAYKVYFEPPLLAKHRQESTPSFFAGSDNPYRLPERLPDVIQFANGQSSVTDAATVRSESSLSLASGVSEDALLDDRHSAGQRTEGLRMVQE
ncbi:hypothetical protein ACOMHN_032062 [Nucella lapillus]